MVFSDGRPEDVGSSDTQEHELRANHRHNSVASSSHLEQETPACSVVQADVGSVISYSHVDDSRSCGVNEPSSSQRLYPDGPRYGVASSQCKLNHENDWRHACTLQCSIGASSGSTFPVTRAASSALSSSSVSNSVMFPLHFNAELTGTRSGVLDTDSPIQNDAETCQLSALGRAGNTGSIDVVSRSGLACQIRSNSIQSSSFLGRLSTEGQPTVEQPTQEPGVLPFQESIRNSGDGSPIDPREDVSRESGALRWVQALEFQGTGACRADERLRPLLRWNVSCIGADGRLLVQLGQHFKAKELNLLARCLCAPLVHIRVGKVLRQGRRLRPTTSRGFLSLRMVPGSDMRLSFIPDGEFGDLLATVSSGSECPSVTLEEVFADVSGRTFLLKLPDGKVLYFWQSEKSKSTGDELISKMKDLLSRRPTLSELTGIEETRLDSFASYISSALNTSSSVEATESAAASAESFHSCAGGSSAPSAKRTGSHASLSFRDGTQLLSLPTAVTRSSSDFEGDSSLCPGGLSQALSQAGVHSVDAPAFSFPHRSSPASWSDGLERRHVALGSKSLTSVDPTTSSKGALEGFSSNTHDQPVLLASSWSTRTSLSDSTRQKQETSSRSAGLYTSLNADFRGHGHDVFQNHCRTTPQAPQSIAAFSLRNSLPAFVGEAVSTSCTRSQPVTSHIPISPTSLLAPYYCPCPLGTLTPPYVPSATEGGLLSPSAPFFSVVPPSSLFPSGSLSFHEFSLSPVQLPVSALVTAAIPIQSSGISPVCTQPVSSVPILHKPTPYMVRTSSALSAYSSTTSEGLEKSFYSCLRPRQAIHDEDRSVNVSTNSSPGVSAWQSPGNLEAFMSVFDPSLSLSATIPCIKSSTEAVTQAHRSFLDRNLAGTPGLWRSFESGIHTQTHTVLTSRPISQVTPFELGLHYASRFVEENCGIPTPAIVDQVSSVSIDLKFKERSFFKDMGSKTRNVTGQTLHSPEICSASGGSRTGESLPRYHSESAEDSSHATVKDRAARRSQHSDEKL